LSDGDPAADDDCWFRFISDTRWITDEDIVSEQALKHCIPDVPRPWAHEWSGRLSSLTNDIVADGNAHVDAICSRLNKPGKNRQFAGVAFNSPLNLRATIGPKPIMTGVFHTPIDPPDIFASAAHADFVTIGSADDDLDAVRTWLQDQLKVLRTAKISGMAALCATIPSTVETVPAVSTTATVTVVGNDPSGT
jgi:hypothetical protein